MYEIYYLYEKRYIMIKSGKRKYIVCFAILVLLCWLFPYTGDDWAWGSKIGIERLNSWFDNYNGRYFGNLIVLALTRSNLLKSFTMAFCLTGIVYCTERIIQRKWAFLTCAVFLLFVPRLVARQAIVWTAGFANYTTSIFLTLIYLVYIWWIFEDKKENDDKNLQQKPVMAILFLLLGVANTLIVEHIAIYNVALSIFVVAFVFLKYKRILVQHLGYFIGSLFGIIYMFSNSGYHSVAVGEDSYRTVAFGIFGIIKRVLSNYFGTIYREFYMNNVVLNAALFFISFLVVFSLRKELSIIILKIAKASVFINSIYLAWSIFSVFFLDYNKPKILLAFEGAFTLLSGLALIYLVVVASIHHKKILKTSFLMLSNLFITATLFVVTPIGSRCFFAGYVFFILLLCELVTMLPEHYTEKFVKYKVKTIANVMIVVLLVFYFIIFSVIHVTDVQRIQRIRQKISEGETVIEVIKYPFSSYLWCSEPGGEIWGERYKYFYDLPEDITLVPVDKYSD